MLSTEMRVLWRRVRKQAVSRVPRLAGFGRPRSRLGIDIGSSQIKIVAAFAYEGRVFVEQALCFDTPPGAVDGYVVQDTVAVADAVRAALDASGVTEKTAVTCVPAPAAMIKRFNLSMADADDLESAVRAEVDNLSPAGSDSLCVDYQVLERADDDGIEVVVAAARAEVARSYARVLENADLIPAAVGVDSLALMNMFEASCPLEAARTVALVHVGARFSLLVVHHHGRPAIAGDVPVGTASQANEPLGRLDPEAPVDFEERVSSAAKPDWYDRVAVEIERALRFYWPTSAGDRLDEILVSGGAAWEQDFLELLSRRTGVSVCSVDPFRRMKRRFERRLRGRSVCAAQFGVAAGLGLHATELS
jgi:type IV pilus assembly protein PilM